MTWVVILWLRGMMQRVVAPVSYTHLDVYKRQLLILSASWVLFCDFILWCMSTLYLCVFLTLPPLFFWLLSIQAFFVLFAGSVLFESSGLVIMPHPRVEDVFQITWEELTSLPLITGFLVSTSFIFFYASSLIFIY